MPFEGENSLDFERDLAISVDSLDQHLLDQAELYGKWSKYAAEAARDVNMAKMNMKEIEAKIAMKVRKNPELYGFEKRATDAGVESIVQTSPEYRGAYLEWVNATHKFDILDSAKWSISARGHSLSELVKLWMNNYMSTAAVSGQSRDMQSELSAKRQTDLLANGPGSNRLRLKLKGE